MMTEKKSIRGEDPIFQLWTFQFMSIRLLYTHMNSSETSVTEQTLSS